MNDLLRLRTVAAADEHVVHASGEVDMASSPRLLTALQQALHQAPRLAVDLADVAYMDSSGVAVLIQGLKAARQAKKPFVLRRPSARVLAVLELADLASLFTIEPKPANAP